MKWSVRRVAPNDVRARSRQNCPARAERLMSSDKLDASSHSTLHNSQSRTLPRIPSAPTQLCPLDLPAHLGKASCHRLPI